MCPGGYYSVLTGHLVESRPFLTSPFVSWAEKKKKVVVKETMINMEDTVTLTWTAGRKDQRTVSSCYFHCWDLWPPLNAMHCPQMGTPQCSWGIDEELGTSLANGRESGSSCLTFFHRLAASRSQHGFIKTLWYGNKAHLIPNLQLVLSKGLL